MLSAEANIQFGFDIIKTGELAIRYLRKVLTGMNYFEFKKVFAGMFIVIKSLEQAATAAKELSILE